MKMVHPPRPGGSDSLAGRHSAPGRIALISLLTVTLLGVGLERALSISVAPHALFLDERNTTSELTLFNGSGVPEEVEIEFLFGYPQGTPEGGVDVPLTDAPDPSEPSAHAWLRAFPRRVRVEPGQRRVVRIQANPPENLADGEYWSRIVVTSQAVGGTAGPDTAVSMGLTFVFRNVLALNFRNGAVNTGLDFDSLWVEPRADSTGVWVDLARSGNAAFLGALGFSLSPVGGEPVWEQAPRAIAVYRRLVRKYEVPTTGLQPGDYELTARVTTAREDIRQADVLPAAPVERTIRFTIP